MENLINECSPAVESMFLCAQPKIYLLLQLVEFFDKSQCYNLSDKNDMKEFTIMACRLVPDFEDKATIVHIYHYYSLKLGEIWNENDILSHDPNNSPSSVESESIDIMTVRHVYLMAFIKKIKNEVAYLDVDDLVSWIILIFEH